MRGVPLFFLALFLFQDPPADPGTPLAWRLGKNDFARYACTKISFDSGGEETERGNPERLVGLFGYEIVDKIVGKGIDKIEQPLDPRIVKAAHALWGWKPDAKKKNKHH